MPGYLVVSTGPISTPPLPVPNAVKETHVKKKRTSSETTTITNVLFCAHQARTDEEHKLVRRMHQASSTRLA
jgi:hypothetical protein